MYRFSTGGSLRLDTTDGNTFIGGNWQPGLTPKHEID